MRILVVSTLYPPAVRGGYEVECADVVGRLREHHEVLVLTSDHPLPAPAVEELVARELPFLSYRKRDSFAAPWSALRAARIADGVLESFRPDLLYVWNGAQIPQAALRVLDRSGVPLAYRICQHWFTDLYRSDVFMRHLYPGDRGLRGLWALLMRAVNRHPALRLDVTTVIPAAVCWNSDALRKVAPAPCTVAPIHEEKIYPATHQSERFRDVARSPAPEPTVLFSGRVSDEKGPDVAYRALAALRDRHGIDARLILAGAADPAMAHHLEVLGAELGIDDRVEAMGRVDGDALVPLMASAHLMVIPSVWEEPAPLVATEAALARLPVVASRVGGIPEMLHPGEHALYFERGDADGCAAAMAETLTECEDTLARAERARIRGLELALPSYLEATERFVASAVATFEQSVDTGDSALPTARRGGATKSFKGAGLLIVTANDWGGEARATDGIVACFRDGRITGATAMVYMADSKRACDVAREQGLSLGLHLNLTQPFDDPATPRPVQDRQRRLVRHFANLKVRRWIYDPFVRRLVAAAIFDQLDAFRSLYGAEPTHIDGHEHVHICPDVLLSRALPSATPIRTAHGWRSGTGPGDVARRVRQAAIARRFTTTDYFSSVRSLVPRLGGEGLEAALELSDRASVEIMTHPAMSDEREYLLSEAWSEALAGRRLGTFADLAEPSRPEPS